MPLSELMLIKLSIGCVLVCPTGCSSCNGQVQSGTTSQCTACIDGYYLDSSNNVCSCKYTLISAE